MENHRTLTGGIGAVPLSRREAERRSIGEKRNEHRRTTDGEGRDAMEGAQRRRLREERSTRRQPSRGDGEEWERRRRGADTETDATEAWTEHRSED